MTSVPAHLKHFPGVFIRKGDDIVAAPETDAAVARGYPQCAAKGAFHEGRRLTLLTAATRVRRGEPVRVIHVAESTRPGDELAVMGPKTVHGEFVDGKARTPPAPPGADPLAPAGVYDGRVEAAPAVDYAWEITEYRFEAQGQHTIVWMPGPLRSNEVVIEVEP